MRTAGAYVAGSWKDGRGGGDGCSAACCQKALSRRRACPQNSDEAEGGAFLGGKVAQDGRLAAAGACRGAGRQWVACIPA